MSNIQDHEESIADVVIDVCGNWDVIPYALRAICHRGIYLFVGSTHSKSSSISIETLLKKCVTIKGKYLRNYFSYN